MLPNTGIDSSYTEAAAAPDGTLLFAGVAGPKFATTSRGVQPRFGGGRVILTNFYPMGQYYCDAFLMRLSLMNPAPKIQLVVPEQVVLFPVGAGHDVEVYGTGFVYGAEVSFNDKPVKVRAVDNEIARNSVESKRPSELIDYATATPFAIGLLETALAIEDNSSGI